jgi:hypothetical protein
MALTQINNGDSGLSTRNNINAGLTQIDTNTQNVEVIARELVSIEQSVTEALNAANSAKFANVYADVIIGKTTDVQQAEFLSSQSLSSENQQFAFNNPSVATNNLDLFIKLNNFPEDENSARHCLMFYTQKILRHSNKPSRDRLRDPGARENINTNYYKNKLKKFTSPQPNCYTGNVDYDFDYTLSRTELMPVGVVGFIDRYTRAINANRNSLRIYTAGPNQRSVKARLFGERIGLHALRTKAGSGSAPLKPIKRDVQIWLCKYAPRPTAKNPTHQDVQKIKMLVSGTFEFTVFLNENIGRQYLGDKLLYMAQNPELLAMKIDFKIK